MNENFLSSFGISAEEDRIDFNRETGEFKLYGKAEIGSQAYRMLEEVYSMQALKDKMGKGELKKEDIHEALELLEKILNTDIPNVQSSIKDIEDFLPNPVFSDEEKFFIEDTKEIDNHPWVIESKKIRKRIHVFADFVDYDTYDKKKVLDLFLTEGNSLEELNVKDRFMAYCIIYHSMFEDTDDIGIFNTAAKAIEHEIGISYPKNKEYCTYRIMLRDKKTGEVSVIYFK